VAARREHPHYRLGTRSLGPTPSALPHDPRTTCCNRRVHFLATGSRQGSSGQRHPCLPGTPWACMHQHQASWPLAGGVRRAALHLSSVCTQQPGPCPRRTCVIPDTWHPRTSRLHNFRGTRLSAAHPTESAYAGHPLAPAQVTALQGFRSRGMERSGKSPTQTALHAPISVPAEAPAEGAQQRRPATVATCAELCGGTPKVVRRTPPHCSAR